MNQARIRVEGTPAAIARFVADLRDTTKARVDAPTSFKARWVDHAVIVAYGPMRAVRDTVNRHQAHGPDVLTVQLLP